MKKKDSARIPGRGVAPAQPPATPPMQGAHGAPWAQGAQRALGRRLRPGGRPPAARVRPKRRER